MRILFCLLWLCLVQSISAQTGHLEAWLDELDNSQAAQVMEQLEMLLSHPIDLNRAGFQKILSMPLVTVFEARNIVEERRRHGPFINWQAFLTRTQLSSQRWEDFSPFFTIKARQPPGKQVQISTLWQLDRPACQGDKTERFQGSPHKHRLRAIIQGPGPLSSRLCIDKDEGEATWNDHMAGHLLYYAKRHPLTIIAGSLSMKAGCGLTWWDHFGSRPGWDITAVAGSRSTGLEGSASATEYNTLQGGGVKWKQGPWTLDLLSSFGHEDAVANSAGVITSLPQSGLHRTATECGHEKKLYRRLYGGRILYSRPSWTLEIIHWYSTLSPRLRNINRQGATGICFHQRRGPWELKAELCKNRLTGQAFCCHFVYRQQRCSAVLSLTSVSADFDNPYCWAMGQSAPENRQNLYAALKYETRPLAWAMTSELTRRPEPTASLPATSWQYRLRAWCTWSATGVLSFRFDHYYSRGLMSWTEQTDMGSVPAMADTHRWRQNLTATLKHSRTWQSTFKISHSQAIQPGPSPGHGWIISLQARRQKRKYCFSAMMLGYSSHHHRTAPVAFMPVLPGQWPMVTLTGQGFSTALTCTCQAGRMWRLGLACEARHHCNGTDWGSGLNERSGPDRFRLSASLQLNY